MLLCYTASGKKLNSERVIGMPQRLLRTVVAILATIGIFGAIAITGATSAHAVDRAADYITSATLGRTDGKATSAPLVEGEKLSFEFSWDATKFYGTDKAPRPGDTLEVLLPSWAKFFKATVPMKDASGNIVANCVQAPKSVTCTFTDYVTNKRDLKGAFSSTFSLLKTERITNTSFPVGTGGVEVNLVSVATPEVIGKGIIGSPKTPSPKTPLNEKDRKHGVFSSVSEMSNGMAIIGWSFFLNGTGNSVTITDTLTSGQTRAIYLDGRTNFKKSVEVVYRDRAEEGTEGGSWELTTSSRPGTAHNLPTTEFEVEWNAEQNQVRINLPATSTDRVYRVFVYTQIEPDALQNGDKISNTGQVNGQEYSATTTARNMVSAYASGVQGIGSAYVYKNVKGLETVPTNYEVRIKAALTLPNGTQEERFLTVRPGHALTNAGKLTELPTDTRVTLSEVTPIEVPGYTMRGVTFGEGKTGDLVAKDDVVISPDKTSVTFTIRNAGVTEIGVTNTYEKVVPQKGKFSVTKRVLPADAGIPAAKSFTVNYTCTKAGAPNVTGSLNVTANQTVESPDIDAGYSCSLAEDEASARVDLFSLAVDNGQAVEIQANAVQPMTVTNTYTRLLGDFKIVKNVAGLPAGTSKTFDFTYVCEHNGAKVKEGAVQVVGAGEAVVTGVPQGAVCTVTENAATAQVEGYSLVVGAAAPVTIGATPVAATVTNSYIKDVGAFSITKKLLDKDGVATGAKFTFDYVCTHPTSGEKKQGELGPIGADETATVTDIAAGSVCTVSERKADIARADLKVSGLDDVTIVTGETKTVEVTNDYSAWRASVKLIKKLSGSAASMKDVQNKEFKVHYVCTLGTDTKEGTVQVSSLKPVVIDDIRSGAECVFTEETGSIAVAGTIFNKDKSTVKTQVVVGDKGQVTEATLNNHFDTPPQKVVPPKSPKSPKIARTGAEATGLFGAAFALALGGAGVVLLRRKH